MHPKEIFTKHFAGISFKAKDEKKKYQQIVGVGCACGVMHVEKILISSLMSCFVLSFLRFAKGNL